MNRVLNNPVLLKELRGRMRGNRAFVLLTTYLLLLSVVVGVVFLIYNASRSPVGSVNDRQVFGKVIYGVVVWLELMTVSFVAPALTSAGISGEREHQTFDLLRTTLLPARSLVFGKFLSGLVFLFLLLFAALPLQSLAFLFGGVAVEEVAIGVLILIVTSFSFCAAGIFFSSLINRSLFSTVLSYAFAILTVFGVPMMLMVLMTMLNVVFSGINSGNPLTPLAETVLILTGWLVVSLNPLATAVATEVILLEEQSAFLFKLPTSSGAQITLISPWILYVIIYLIVGLLMLAASVRLVRKVER